MDLKVATLSEINDELERRKMLERNAVIKKLFEEITVAYNTGKIAHIACETTNSGTSVVSTKYFISLK